MAIRITFKEFIHQLTEPDHPEMGQRILPFGPVAPLVPGYPTLPFGPSFPIKMRKSINHTVHNLIQLLTYDRTNCLKDSNKSSHLTYLLDRFYPLYR